MKKSNLTLLFICTLVVFAGALIFGAKPAYAGVVYPAAEYEYGGDDRMNIQQELDTTGSVTLVDGKTYRLGYSLRVSSNMTINAGSATVICAKAIMVNIPECADYKAIENLTVNGGIWKSESENGASGSSIKITHGNNIKFNNMKVRHNNALGHTIELVACKNVSIKNCNFAPLGTEKSKTEEAIQLDIASHTTAYFLESEPFNTLIAKQLQNGAACQNITIANCTITGNRGIVANYTAKEDGKYLKKLHNNIVLKNNKITSAGGEAVALFNTKNATVSGNKIICNAKGSDSYTVGLHFDNFGKTNELKSGKITVKNNTVKGGRQAFMIYSHTASKYGKVTISSNKLYCKKGKKAALYAKKDHCTTLKISKNKLYSRNG